MTKASGVGRNRIEELNGEKKEWAMKGHRTRKIAPINMRKDEVQHVIDGYTVDEVIKQIPDKIEVLGAKIRVYSASGKRRIIVSNELKSAGVQSIYVGKETVDMTLVFDKIKKTSLVRHVKYACKEANLDYDKAYFTYLLLSNGEANGRFEHCTKEQKPDETDLRKKLRVLGLVSGTGKVQSLVADLHAKKFMCSIKEEAVKFVMCRKI